MNYFNFKYRNLLSGPHLLGTLLILAGVFALVSPSFFKSGGSLERAPAVGTGAVIAGLLIASSYVGTLIDFTEKRFKEYTSIVGYKFGEWTNLPRISKVKVVSSSHVRTNTPNGISPTISGKVVDFRVLIYSNGPKPVLSFVYANRDKALRQAKRLAANLDADLVLSIPGGEGKY